MNHILAANSKKEQCFELPLPVLVSGFDATGKRFQEQTELSTISAQQATFHLNSGVTIGSKLDLSLDIPKTIVLEKQIRLFLTGSVIYIKAETNNKNKRQLISVRLDKKYRIRTQPS